MEKVFKKEKWLQHAQAEVNNPNSNFTQACLELAYNSWVLDMDGKTVEEIGEQQSTSLEKYFG